VLELAPREGSDAAALIRDADAWRSQLAVLGALLFRGYAIHSREAFGEVVSAVTPALLEYDYASTPRTRLGDRIYSSTEYPAHQSIPLHNEMAYSSRWPQQLWFACRVPAPEGGATPLADSAQVYALLDPALRSRFEERGVRYVRNYGTGLDLPWSKVFGTEDARAVEAYCADAGIRCQWRADGVLHTQQVCPAVQRHPATGALVWFNQAHLFHISALDPLAREALTEVVEEADWPRHAYYGDGQPIEESALEEIRGVYAACAREFRWRAGDVLWIDNLAVAHGRSPFRKPREVLVAMA
jgi:alpha-ketoglutarate-dependent taurine dioxygenase